MLGFFQVSTYIYVVLLLLLHHYTVAFDIAEGKYEWNSLVGNCPGLSQLPLWYGKSKIPRLLNTLAYFFSVTLQLIMMTNQPFKTMLNTNLEVRYVVISYFNFDMLTDIVGNSSIVSHSY